MAASSANTGFFQEVPVLRNQVDDDWVYRRCVRFFLPPSIVTPLFPHLRDLASEALDPKVLSWVSSAERNVPRIEGDGRNMFGKVKNGGGLVLDEGWDNLGKLGQARGYVGCGYLGVDAFTTGPTTPTGYSHDNNDTTGDNGDDGKEKALGKKTGGSIFNRPLQFHRLLLWEASAGNTTCPSAMQDGAARLLELHLDGHFRPLDGETERVLREGFERLTRGEWTCGQWMTEREGGSWVGGSGTVGVFDPEGAGTNQESGVRLVGANPGEVGQVCQVGEEAEAQKTGIQLLTQGPWRIDGAKWFSSGTDAEVTVMLAQTELEDGSWGLSAFFAPVYGDLHVYGNESTKSNISRRTMTTSSSSRATHPTPTPSSLPAYPLPVPKHHRSLNNLSITRLKRKLGTRSLPTAELSLTGTRAWLLGRKGEGIRNVVPILTLTRIHSAIAALGYVGRGLQISRAFMEVRKVGGGKGRNTGVALWRMRLHVRSVAAVVAGYWGGVMMAGFVGEVLGVSERGGVASMNISDPTGLGGLENGGIRAMIVAATTTASTTTTSTTAATGKDEELAWKRKMDLLLRTLPPLLKLKICPSSNTHLQSLMESLGGVGYLENAENEGLNIARLVRDGMVLSIWEGTTDVLSTDFVRAVKHPRDGEATLRYLEGLVIGGLEWVEGKSRRGSWVWDFEEEVKGVREAWEDIKTMLSRERYEDIIGDARTIAVRTAEVLMVVVGMVDAVGGQGEEGMEAVTVCKRLVREFGMVKGCDSRGIDGEGEWKTDLRIVFGRERSEEMMGAEGAKL